MPKLLSPQEQFFESLQAFAGQLAAKFSAMGAGEPEDQLKPSVDRLFTEFGKIILHSIVLKGESTLDDRLGRPDFAAHSGQLPIGYIELKAPGKGANPKLYKGHDKKQWERFQNVPNLIYTDGNEWALYRNGVLQLKRIRMDGDITTDGEDAVSNDKAVELFQLIADFIKWTPIVPNKPKELAAFLAPFCRMIREEVLDSLDDKDSPMQSLKTEIKALLFPDADDAQFADAYAQTVIFAMLLGQMEGANVLDLRNTYDTLAHHHSLLSRSLEFLTDKEAQKEISASLSMTQRVIHEIPAKLLIARSATKDPWLFFYEDFLAAYDPKLRKEAGVYFTPLEVVRCQVRLIDEILHKHMGRKMGFVEAGVATLDPAEGTGTYLLAIVEHALDRVEKEEGPGAVKGGASALVRNLHGFEWMVGPYAVAQLRFSQALTKYGISLPPTGPSIYLTNTLESPHTNPPAPPLFHKPIAQEHERALKVKESDLILVCMGNPPYGRHEASTGDNRAVTGGWVRYGDRNHPDDKPILEAFLKPAREAGYSVHLKNLYNLYVYFIRWSLWKVFEHKTATGPGILSFITASSYLDGDAFVGVREHMRRICDHIDIIDLGGEGRGTRKDENVFAIQTPVAIFVAWRKAKPSLDAPAAIRYVRIEGTREEKLKTLDSITSSDDLKWESVPSEWHAPFIPIQTGTFTKWPNITDIFPWQSNGVKAGRTWVIAPSKENLRYRLTALLKRADLPQDISNRLGNNLLNPKDLFKDSPTGRKLSDKPTGLTPLLAEVYPDTIAINRYSYRSFDRQYVVADARFLDRPSPSLWHTHSDRQMYLSSMFNHPLGGGQAITVCSEIPDLHHFRGSFGAKEILPLYRDAAGTKPNIMPGLLELLSNNFGCAVAPEDLAGYVYGVLSYPEYTRKFANELSGKEIRVPLTKDKHLFAKVFGFGKELIWLHTYGECLSEAARPKGEIPKGKTKCLRAVSDQKDKYPNEFRYDENNKELNVGDGVFGPISPAVWEFEVSGLKVVQSWLGHRMKDGSGKKSSPLDDIRPQVWTYEFTRELLELLWVLERTVEGYPKQKELFEAVLDGELFNADELPGVPDTAREAPKVDRTPADQTELGY